MKEIKSEKERLENFYILFYNQDTSDHWKIHEWILNVSIEYMYLKDYITDEKIHKTMEKIIKENFVQNWDGKINKN